MGKVEAEGQNPQVLQSARSSSRCCRCCSSAGFVRIRKAFSFRCILFLILGVAVSISAILWLPPFRSRDPGFNGGVVEKLAAPVQASFALRRPVSVLVAYAARLEQEIYDEIEIPNTKVSIISMSPSADSNLTNVVFGVFPDPGNAPIPVLPLSILRSSLIDLVLQQLNLTLTLSLFGRPSSFEVLKFPGGITLIPGQSLPIKQRPQILFNFTLNNSISQIHESAGRLKLQLRNGLQLRSNEYIYFEVTNVCGSTVSPPVVIQASVVSEFGGLSVQRLKQLAEVFSILRVKNLGLDHSLFGKVKEIQLSSFLQDSLAPSSSPSFSPLSSPSPSSSPYLPPIPYAPKTYTSPMPAASHSPATPSHAPGPSTGHHHLSPCFNSKSSPKNHPDLARPPNLEPTAPYAFPAASPVQSPTTHFRPSNMVLSRRYTVLSQKQPTSPSAMLYNSVPCQDQERVPVSSMSCTTDVGVWLIGMMILMPYLLFGV